MAIVICIAYFLLGDLVLRAEDLAEFLNHSGLQCHGNWQLEFCFGFS
jgi:hypothetical protein